MKQWIGRSIVVIGILHTIVGLIGLRSILAVLLNEGIVNTVNQQPEREMAFWCLFFGFLVIVFGGLIDWCEAQEVKLPLFLGWGLLTIAVMGAMIMPISGFWLLIIPSIGVIRQKSPTKANVKQ